MTSAEEREAARRECLEDLYRVLRECRKRRTKARFRTLEKKAVALIKIFERQP
jgi:hypothetical protein